MAYLNSAIAGHRAIARVPLAARSLLGAAFLVYFVSTVLLYFLGPWDYPMHDAGRLIGFLIAVHAAFAVGYVFGVRGGTAGSAVSLDVNRLVLLTAIVELALLFPTSHYATGQWLPNPWTAAEDFGRAYTTSLHRREVGIPVVNYVRMVVSPLLGLGVPLGVFYWTRLATLTRVLFGCSVVGTIALFIAMGANAGAAHWMALFPWFVLASHIAGVQRLNTAGWIKAGAIEVASMLLFVLLFSATMVQRTGSFAKYGYMPGIGAGVEHDDLMPPADRSAARIGADGFAAYLTHGYFAVYLSLQEPFRPCYGVGNSVFLQRQLARITGGTYFLECSYPARIAVRGWRTSAYWATIYPWIASDVTFPGTVLVVLVLGWLVGCVWMDTLGGRNLFAVALLGQLLVLLYYVPAHNKTMHSGEGTIAFWTLCAAWLVTRRRGPA